MCGTAEAAVAARVSDTGVQLLRPDTIIYICEWWINATMAEASIPGKNTSPELLVK